jgi:hypothetical protein
VVVDVVERVVLCKVVVMLELLLTTVVLTVVEVFEGETTGVLLIGVWVVDRVVVVVSTSTVAGVVCGRIAVGITMKKMSRKSYLTWF